uniref:CCHC-type domain-containing protein n=1 Tax=Tanacetum cinerariifolium TaxID=118510 RepID=A0A6L2JKH3_TANCI|nr:hypothetical protein [Tanacetum cinerariifolium]
MADIYATGSKSRPPMLNKENYVPWSSHLLRYAKSRPNRKLIHNTILNGPYVRRMIPEPGDVNHEVNVTETFHMQTDDEVYEKELKQIEADDQAIQTILLGLPEDIYAAVDSCETAQEIWLRPEWNRHITIVHQTKDMHTADYTQLYDFLKYDQKEVDELKAERLAKTQDPLALMANSNNPYAFPAPRQDQSSFNQNYLLQLMPNHEDIRDPATAMNMALALMAKAFKLDYSTPTNNNQRISSNPRNRQIAQPGQNARNLTGYNDVQNVGNQVSQNPRVQNVENENGLIGVPRNGNQNGNGNLVAVRAEGNAVGQNGNQIKCYSCREVGYYARNCTVRPRRRDAAYLQTQLLIAQKEEAGIQLQAEEYDLMAAATDLDEIEKVNANWILMDNLQQASTFGTQTDSAPVYDSDGSAEGCLDSGLSTLISLEKLFSELIHGILTFSGSQERSVGEKGFLAGILVTGLLGSGLGVWGKGLVQQAKLLKEKVFILDPNEALMSTQQYMDKVVEDVGDDDDIKSAAWVSATNYVNTFGGTVTGCLGDVNNFLNNGKLELVVGIVKSCSQICLAT